MQHTVITLPLQPQFPIAEVAAAIQSMIDAGQRMDMVTQALLLVLDKVTPDPDLELNGDETDHCNSEDCFVEHSFYGNGPGCPIADPDYGGDEAGEPEDGI